MEEITTNITWSPLLEEYFKKTAEKAQCYSWLYNQSESWYGKRKSWLDIPQNILASVTGFLSVGSSTMFEGETKLASIALGVASLIVSVMNMTKSYFAYDKRAEGCRITAISWAKMYRFLSLEMSLPCNERLRPSDLLKLVKEEIDRLNEISPPIPLVIIEIFKKRFSNEKYAAISKPEITNGLEAVVIFKDNILRSESLKIRTPVEPLETKA